MPVVCGTDFSEHARGGAIAAAAVALRRGEPEVWLVHAVEPDLESYEGTTARELERAARRRLEAEAERLAAETGVRFRPQTSAELLSDFASAPEALCAAAERLGATLIVVASTGYARTPLLRVGGTAERVARIATVPVLVVRDPAPFRAWGQGTRPLRVAVGVDESVSAAAALRWAKELRASGPSHTTVAHVYWRPEALRRYGLGLEAGDEELERLVARDVEALVGAMPGEGPVAFRCAPGVGRVGDHLVELAEREGADVLVVGTHRRRALGRLESVSAVALHFGQASVVCVPAEAAPALPREVPRIRRVVAATDLSIPGNAAVAHAYGLLGGGGGGGEVHLVHVADPALPAGDDVELAARVRAAAPRLAPGRDVVTRVEILRGGDPARAICELAERVGADVICVASHGRSGVRRALLGSVAESVLRTSSRPVLVVRAPPP